LLVKDPKKRMTIKQVLEHSWIKKFCNSNITEKRREYKDTAGNSNFVIYVSTEEKEEL